MRSVCTLLACALLFPAAAAAQSTTAPPGNAGIDQYLETVPSASGDRAVKPRRGSDEGLRPETRRALEAQGTDGKLAADLAAGGAPSAGPGGGAGTGNGQSGAGGVATLPDESVESPLAAVVEAVTGGSSSGSGMGALLPILLLISLATMVVAALLRHRPTD